MSTIESLSKPSQPPTIEQPSSFEIPEILRQLGLVSPLAEYEGNSPRLKNLQLLKEVRETVFQKYGIVTLQPQVVVLTHSLFQVYLENNHSFPQSVQKALEQLITQALTTSETGLVSLRRAYWTPENPLPPGPAYNALPTPQEVLAKIKTHYRYCLEQPWIQDPRVEVSLMLQEFTNPSDVRIENGRLVQGTLPYGGEAFYNPFSQSVIINVVLGDNRGVTSNIPRDTIIIQSTPTGPFIRERTTAYKTQMWLDREGRLTPFQIPSRFHIGFAPLNDLEALKLAIIVQTLKEVAQDNWRIEFSVGQKGVYINEALPFTPPTSKIETQVPAEITGRVLAVLRTPEDVKTLRRLTPKRGDAPVVYIHPQLAGDTTQLTLALQYLKQIREKRGWSNLTVLCPGTATEHAFRVLILQTNFQGVPLPQKAIIRKGDRIEIQPDEAGNLIVHNLTVAGRGLTIYVQEYPHLLTPDQIGNKAYSLLEPLGSLDLPTPPAFCLTHGFFVKTLEHNGCLKDWFSLSGVSSQEELEEKFQQIQESLTALHPKFWNMFLRLLKRNLGPQLPLFAVRSTTPLEDLILYEGRSFTGEFYTGLGVPFEQLKKEVLKVIHSLFTPQMAQSIWGQVATTGKEMLARWSMPVLVMPQVEAQSSGTVFHVDPVTRNPDIITIEAQPGVGGIVAGEQREKTLTVKINALTGEVISITLQEGRRQIPINSLTDLTRETTLLTADDVLVLKNAALVIHQKTGVPHDTEWAYGSLLGGDPQLWFLQTRPIVLT